MNSISTITIYEIDCRKRELIIENIINMYIKNNIFWHGISRENNNFSMYLLQKINNLFICVVFNKLII